MCVAQTTIIPTDRQHTHSGLLHIILAQSFELSNYYVPLLAKYSSCSPFENSDCISPLVLETSEGLQNKSPNIGSSE